MKRNIIISFLIISALFANMEKYMVKITFNNHMELHKLVELGIDLDHHRTITEVHAFVTNEEFELISQLNFGIQKIENQAKLYFEELKKNTYNTRNPMEDYHDYNELTSFLQNIANCSSSSDRRAVLLSLKS